MLQRILTICVKELRDAQRDRRALVVMVIVPVFLMPLFAVLPQILLGGQVKLAQGQGSPGTWVADVHGAAHSPSLIAFLRQAGAVVREVTGDPEAYVRADSSRVVIVIPPGL